MELVSSEPVPFRTGRRRPLLYLLPMRVNLRTLVVAAATLTIAACGDSSTAPGDASALRPAGHGPSLDLSLGNLLLGTDFTLNQNGGTFPLAGGLYTIVFPTNAVCDLNSTYGTDQWDQPCTLATKSIKVHATVSVTSTGLAVDFSPSLRFSPSATVILYTDTYAATIKANSAYFSANHAALRPFAMYWAPTFLGATVPDYLTDPTAVTHVNLTTGRIWRRVKHFSGYSLSTGQACNPSPDDPDCIEVDGDGLQ